ncbi:DUF72 domain-containing protein [Flavobacterium sp. DG1-102-2]|uniref:DUF72 domain-containing protein n=1 Tax=Flavobacterium sp. DG1-102-2 TaxID=3081663 RepID=UPI002948FA3B|nr:DUF72 domain-containing protein [Flavobacterium sp. DG1-102-2]MDV6167839.1 DUF72 domain-containing protein [Flavobacterium sp. DG1-102-2]
MKNKIHIGLSAFNNSYWKGIFYPEDLPASKRFDYYCQHFSTYEINATFYKFPTDKSMKAWYDKSPDGFLFSVKTPKTITHLKKFIDAQSEINEFYKICSDNLREKLGFVLFQLPPSFNYTPERLTLIIESLDMNFKNVVEFRNESWWIPEVFEAFTIQGIIFCSVSYPKLSSDIVNTTHSVYVRLHGVPKLFYSAYSDEELEVMFKAITEDTSIKDAYIYFNNTAGKEGIINALRLKELTL